MIAPQHRDLAADLLTPLGAFLRIGASSRNGFLFESVAGGEQVARYSFLGSDPFAVIRLRGSRLRVEGDLSPLREAGEAPLPPTGESEETDPPGLLRRLLRPRATAVAGLPPFPGGAIIVLGYDAIRYLERLPEGPPRTAGEDGADDVIAAFYDAVVAFDHARCLIHLLATPLGTGARAVKERLDELETLLCREGGPAPPARLGESGEPVEEETLPGREGFCRAVTEALGKIRSGEILQVVLSRRIRRRFDGDPIEVYRALRRRNPSPYMFFLRADGATLVGASPERLVRVVGERVETMPIAGTRARGADEIEDAALEAELLSDAKERAEHMMLVDLARNDIGRVCRPGTIEVRPFARVERYSHVMHMVSGVRGHLRDGISAIDALYACFPAGTVSGAPKVRAMEIIAELERHRRGYYAGAVGYASFTGDLDSCIAIRTAVLTPGRAEVIAGAGIVADSDPGREWDETKSKSAALLAALEEASRNGIAR